MNREYHRWYTERLGRDMELLVFGHAGAKVLVFPTRDGRFHEYEDLRLVESLRPKIEAGHLQLFCLDSIDHEALYCFWRHPAERIRRHVQFEEYVLNEVFPLMAAKNPHPCTIAHGCSLGAFHAVNIAFRDLFDGYYDDTIYYHTPSHFLPNLGCPWRLKALRRMDIVLVVGGDDPFLGNNRDLSRILCSKGIAHTPHTWDGRAYQGHAWRKMAPLYV
jgi:esterase/lipase superfamily enzyme